MGAVGRLGLGVALVAAFLLAPFAHIHALGAVPEHVAKTHASSLALHLHLAGRHQSDSSWRQADDSALRLNWFQLEKLSSLLLTKLPDGIILRLPDTAAFGRPLEQSSDVAPRSGAPPPALRGPPILL